jgi:hypothetical protein
MLPRTPRWVLVALALAVSLPLAWLPAAADDTVNLPIKADIAAVELTLTICDNTVDFGSGLNYRGSLPTSGSTTDSIAVTAMGGSTTPGVYYIYTPPCQVGQSTTPKFIEVRASIPWKLTACATNGSSTSSLSATGGDLLFTSAKQTTYDNVTNIGAPFPSCAGAGTQIGQSSADLNMSKELYLYLHVDRNDTAGTFQASTTWTLVP